MTFNAKLDAQQYEWLQSFCNSLLARIDILEQQVSRLNDFLDRVQIAPPKGTA